MEPYVYSPHAIMAGMGGGGSISYSSFTDQLNLSLDVQDVHTI